MKRKESKQKAERNSTLVQRIKEIKAEHPFWGYRRTWAHLKFVDKLEVNKKRVLRLMQKHSLLVKPNQKLKANRTMKEELLWLREWNSPFELVDALSDWIAKHNSSYLHSALGYKAPTQYENEYRNSQNIQLVSA